jgi:uncharacterized membrane protein YkoI
MQISRKKIIDDALTYDIEDVSTYSGYKGDLIVKITTKEKASMIAIRKFALNLGVLDVVLKHDPNTLLYEIYCVTEDENGYTIKVDENNVKKAGEHIDDVWSKTLLN